MKRALLVEHHPGLRETLSSALDDAGYEADAVATLAQARSLLDADDYNLVMANDRLPDGRGYDVAAAADALGIRAFLVRGSVDELSLAPVGHPHLQQSVSPADLAQIVAHLVEHG